MGAVAAKELAERQRRYDRIHHLKRVHELQQLPKLDMVEREMLRQSRRELDAPLIGRSVDLSDTAYLSELDQFAALTTPSAGAQGGSAE